MVTANSVRPTSESSPAAPPAAIRAYAEDLAGVGLLATIVLFLGLETVVCLVILAATLATSPGPVPVFHLGGR